MKKLNYDEIDLKGVVSKINEIVAWANEQEAVEKALENAEPSASQYPDFDKWDREAIETNVWLHTNPDTVRDSFLVVAPENFHIEHGGKIKMYFTWDEAREYEEKVLKPHGWRLPTAKEVAMLCATYVDTQGCDDVRRFEKELNFARDGYVDSDGEVTDINTEGDWWTSTFSCTTTTARCLTVGSYFSPQGNANKDFGLSVRAVKESA